METPAQPRVLVILGSSREDSNTLKAVRALSPFPDYQVIDLHESNIRYYDYDPKKNVGDGFVQIAERMLSSDVIIFATPIYWYSMSGQMKVFFDRLTHLTAEYKPMGKALKGKKTFLIVTGASEKMPEGFEIPFKHTSEYFDMEFVSSFYKRAR